MVEMEGGGWEQRRSRSRTFHRVTIHDPATVGLGVGPQKTWLHRSASSQVTSEAAETFILAATEDLKRQRRCADACGGAGGARAATLCGRVQIGVRERRARQVAVGRELML